jgi:hypothetical protein
MIEVLREQRLAAQVRQNSKLLRASTASATSQVQFTQNAMMGQDSEVARIYWEGVADRDSLSEEDRRRFAPLMQIMFQGNSQKFEFHRDGIGGAGPWGIAKHGSGGWLLQQPGVQQSWREWGENVEENFREFVDGRSARAKLPGERGSPLREILGQIRVDLGAARVPSRIRVPSYSPLCAAPCRDLPGRERNLLVFLILPALS